MNKILLTNLRWLFMSLMLATGVGSAWGQTTTTYTFSSKAWAASPDNWTSGKDGNQMQSGRGIQVTTGASGANATSPTSFNNISQVVVTYSTNASAGVGSVEIQVGSNTAVSQNVTKTGGTTDRTLTYDFSPTQSGTVKITVTCTTNSIYIKSVAITYGGGTPKTDSEVTFPESSYTTSYPGSFSAPTATVANANTHAAISGATVSYESNNTSVATINSSTGAVTLTGFGTATITATYAGNNTYNGSTGSYTLTVTDGRAATTTSFPSSTYEAILGESFSSPTATVKNASTNATISGAATTYNSSNTAVATISGSTVSIVGVGTTTITATYEGDTNYKPSSGSYTLTVTDASGVGGEDVTIWSEDFSSFSSGDVPTTGTNASYSCSGTGTKVFTGQMYAGGEEPELLVAKSGGSFTVTITSIKQCIGTLTLSFKANRALAVTSNTSGVTITQTSSSSPYEYSISGASDGFTLIFSNSTSNNARVDDFVLTGTRRTDVTEVDNPTLSSAFTFWPATTETATAKVTITMPSSPSGATVRYTTDGSTPSKTVGNILTTTTDVEIHGTTTVKAIAYYGDVTSGVVSQTYTLGQTVNDIASFKALTSGTEARLYLNPSKNARVLHVSGSEIYVRDNTGAICLYLNTSLQNPVPQHDWHVAGWIIGKYQPYNGLPELVATSNTTTNYMAFAAPVTETPTEPVAITASDFDNKLADWVTVPELRVSISGTDTLMTAVTEDATQLKLRNAKFKIGSSGYYNKNYAYDGALIDVTGIAIPYNTSKQISPIYYSDYRPVIYVMDEQQDFNSPSANIQNATVRLVRTLSSSNWNTFAVPFAINDMEGTIRQYASVDGTTMVYANANSIAAGVPYLVKPTTTITNPTYTDVTLTSTEAQTVTKGNYSFVAIYSPTNIYAADNTQRFLKTDGYLYYPTSETAGRLKGMRAYFIVPDGSGSVKVNPDGMETSIDDLDVLRDFKDIKVYDTSGRMVGNDLRGLPRGIYIVNGKKIVVQ